MLQTSILVNDCLQIERIKANYLYTFYYKHYIDSDLIKKLLHLSNLTNCLKLFYQ
jgi:hypothetical protein